MRSKPASVWSSLYLQRVLREDIVPCLRSNNVCMSCCVDAYSRARIIPIAVTCPQMMAHQEQLLDLNHTNDLVMESLTAPMYAWPLHIQ